MNSNVCLDIRLSVVYHNCLAYIIHLYDKRKVDRAHTVPCEPVEPALWSHVYVYVRRVVTSAPPASGGVQYDFNELLHTHTHAHSRLQNRNSSSKLVIDI